VAERDTRPRSVLGADGRMRVRWDGGEPPEEASAELFVLGAISTPPPGDAGGR
jgi:hypothetical protein